MLCQIRKVSTAEDFELQVRRLDEMGKIIDTLTTMLTKPPQPKGSANEKIRGDEVLPPQQKTLQRPWRHMMKPLKSQQAVFLCEENMINLRYERSPGHSDLSREAIFATTGQEDTRRNH